MGLFNRVPKRQGVVQSHAILTAMTGVTGSQRLFHEYSGRLIEEWEGVHPQTFSVPPPGICLDDTKLIPNEARLYLHSIEIFHCHHRLRQLEVVLKTSISPEWSTGSLCRLAGLKALTDSECTRTHLRGPRI